MYYSCPPAGTLCNAVVVCMQERWWVLKSLWSMAAIPAAFAAFVYRNGGVAVGDKEHHTPVMHLMQIPYLLLFTGGCLAAVHLAPSRCIASLCSALYLPDAVF